MHVTSKGRVTIPQHIREKLGLTPHREVEFVEEGDRVSLLKEAAPHTLMIDLERFEAWLRSR